MEKVGKARAGSSVYSKTPQCSNLSTINRGLTYVFIEKTGMSPFCAKRFKECDSLRGENQRLVLSDRQFRYLSRELYHANKVKPGWLRREIKNNVRRRAYLKRLLTEYGLDKSWCPNVTDRDAWSSELHMLWHTLEYSQFLANETRK